MHGREEETRVARRILEIVVVLAMLATAGGQVIAPSVLAAESTRYSGTVVAIDPQRGILVMDEAGPGRGRTLIVVRRTIGLTAATRFRSFIRVNVPGAFAGDFIEVALDAEDVSPGDFVTAECVLSRGRPVANRVTLAESVQLPSSPGADRP
jgi:hypothetical protein